MKMIRYKEEQTMRRASLCRGSSTVIPPSHIGVHHGKYPLYRLDTLPIMLCLLCGAPTQKHCLTSGA
eukprot:2585406-Pleurochrysis_carterae.AAC.1